MADSVRRRAWTREETLVAFNLYCRIPFQHSNKSHPDVRHVAKLIGRTPDAVNMKVGNFGSFDPELKKRGIKGLAHSSRLVKEVWDEFHNDWERLINESEQIIAEKEKAATSAPPSGARAREYPKEGKERAALVNVRENQPFFRRAVLSAYDGQCCITGINLESLLVASHIKPWAKSDKTEKLNPRNGLCLNALHDRAFDRGLITIANDHTIIVSNKTMRVANAAAKKVLLGYEGQKIQLPARFIPDAKFLAWHRDNIFKR